MDELISQTAMDAATADLLTAKQIKNKTIDDILIEVDNAQGISSSDKQVISDVLKNIGNSMADSEIDSLSYAISKLQNIIETFEKTVKERKQLFYKLTPLLCGALAVILW